MDRLIYSAVSGMNASMAQQRAIASNMANSGTIGFKAELLDARPVTVEGTSLEVRAMNRSEVRGASMAQGTVTDTGNPLDVALTGDTMLALQGADGSEVYSRRGDLSVSASGALQNGDGLVVLGTAGPITVPAGGALSIARDGTVLMADPAAPEAPVEVGKLKLVSTTGTDIAKGLDGQFRVRGGGTLPEDIEAEVIPGSLEQSNVAASEVLTSMIEAQRLFEIRTNVVSTARDIDESGARLMRLDA
ncbi:flagellar basal body rod protein FlgF [Croceicoccus mobilis]|uniref:Flagellar basal-body rod protein FlgF n=1 Tax=Croceicoccus mobilis TaxID=1703339 RepID=A0A916YX40_9SPHN|nr:flagellar basal body rod protein FlgF [Croceicoccus mobilis]GGD63970.1 flagellar basal body protein [Croceicoccus mobilis]